MRLASGPCYCELDGQRLRVGNERCGRVWRSDEPRTVALCQSNEVRPGYFGLMNTGPLFVENRYTDFHRYWPHQTLRNLWKLAHYVDPLRLRREFLNQTRNQDLYHGDPLAQSVYCPAYLFATVMFSNPLGWFEVSNLPESYFEEVAPLVRLWKEHREALFSGTLYPIGDAPDGTTWAGFASVGRDRASCYLLVFRELNDEAEWETELPVPLAAAGAAKSLAGEGTATVRFGRLTATIPSPQSFLFAHVDPTR